MMDAHFQFATKDEFWRLQEDLKDIYATQAQQAERLSRLERRRDEDNRMKSLWGPQSPFPTGVASTPQQEYNPAAEAFKNFESESQSGMISSLHLDHDEERRRGASRANSVRFDESAMNHYGATSRQSMDMLPVRTGSGMGMSERSYSHRSDGRGSTSGLSMRANSFGLESSRLLGSSTGSPRPSSNPPPGFLFLGPVPSIIRCWLSEDFSTNSVLYAGVCSGSYNSSISSAVVRQLELEHNLLEESGLQKIKLSVYLTEATIQHSSSRSGSPVPQVPSLTAKFTVYEASHDDPSIQVILGSDVLRSHNGDILFSEDRLLVFDDERNRLAVPLVRPESESVYQSLSTVGGFLQESQNARAITKPVSHGNTNGNLPPGFNQAPPKFDLQGSSTDSSAPTSPAILPTNESARDTERGKLDVDASADLGDQRDRSDDNQSSNGEKPSSGPKPSNVWGSSSWRSGSSAPTMADAAKSTASGYSRAVSGRGMKVLRPSTGKSMANYTRTVSGTAGDSKPFFEQPPRQASFADTAKSQATAAKSTSDPNAAPTKANPIGQASAFGWLNSSAAGGRDRSVGGE